MPGSSPAAALTCIKPISEPLCVVIIEQPGSRRLARRLDDDFNETLRVLSCQEEPTRFLVNGPLDQVAMVIVDRHYADRHPEVAEELIKRRVPFMVLGTEETANLPGTLSLFSSVRASGSVAGQLSLFDDSVARQYPTTNFIPPRPKRPRVPFSDSRPRVPSFSCDSRLTRVLFAGLGDEIAPSSDSKPRERGKFQGFIMAHGIDPGDPGTACTLRRVQDLLGRGDVPEVLVLGHCLKKDGEVISPLEAIDEIIYSKDDDSRIYDHMKMIVVYPVKILLSDDNVPDPEDKKRLDGELDALFGLRNQHPGFRVVFLCESTVPPSLQKSLIEKYGPDEYLESGTAPARLLKRVCELVQRMCPARSTAPAPAPGLSQPISCKFKGNPSRNERSAEDVRKLMDFFSRIYIPHMLSTGHFSAQHMVMMALQSHFGINILDAGCGPGNIMRRFIRESMVPRFGNNTRQFTRILSVDSSQAMLTFAINRAERMMGYKDLELPLHLQMLFLEQDLVHLGNGDFESFDFPQPDTILASYLISWVRDKRGTVEKLHELLAPGGALVTMEEVHQTITPSPFMVPELSEGILSNIEPVESLEVYYGMLIEAGFIEAAADLTIPIDSPEDASRKNAGGLPPHNLRGKVFIKP